MQTTLLLPERPNICIVVEGLDRSGKSTQCQLLVDSLNAQRPESCKLLKFPDRSTTIGKMIHAYLTSEADLDDRAIHLLFSANRWEAESAMRQDIENGITLVLDRYIYSGAAFSIIKGLNPTWCRACDIGLPSPDLVLFLDLSVETAAKRGGFGEERYEKADLQYKVRQAFLEMAKAGGVTWQMFDANTSIDDLASQIESTVKHHCRQVSTNALKSVC
ncbi:thymidylate kinase-domain-containing protein [Protomyces lactucae-debilis]|uniref:Thymidylate kinase n=1 Tax=Protomyces lactucae-debilis TaxID=2754530 RepID=A0A1Y2FNQ3_PROLT|nr:thymidylate kinase-domain-containing protein [Protomyces lactucae-debilis]ORY84846.1 thymidylate kinase-domain-containing protein [Protomyces lactucae-debilis]